ncbi:hypothetical protein pdam_00010215 [Pocillopora damicornis]|uniref:Laminin G domain-containing protein n=1 Tax=Pocillopora damicornis TaxID=46731 RepID=A0A3M6TAU6_POCDA|nr:hypothetical protein pdam_00010215 [Pocillopora damicornis]
MIYFARGTVCSPNRILLKMLKVWLTVQICLAITICQRSIHGGLSQRRNSKNNTWKYGNFAYSAYRSVQFTDNSTIVIRFKTTKTHGMLFYMDDGGVQEFMDAFLLNGLLRVRISMGKCTGNQRFINGSFADLKWHKLTLQRMSESVIVEVDSLELIYLCRGLKRTDFNKYGPFFVSFFPLQEWGKIKWNFRDSFSTALAFGGFEGCIKTPKFAVGDQKLRRASLWKSERAVEGCRDACKDPSFGGKCYNGGKCVNKIVRRECDCSKTRFNGPNCSRVALLDSVAGLHFHEGADWSFAEFRGWAMSRRSELQFYFKTGASRSALLLYQDNKKKNTDNDFLEMSLNSDGYVQLYVRGNRCFPEKRTIRQNFTDDTWHLVTIARNSFLLNFSVDDITAETISCVAPPQLSGFDGKAINSLYIGGIPFLDSQGDPTLKAWSLTGLFQKVGQEYRAECDCEKTGYYGRFCEQKAVKKYINSTGSSHVNRIVSNGTDVTAQKNNTKDDDNNVSSGGDVNAGNGDGDDVNDPGKSTKGVAVSESKKAHNGVSPLVVSPPVCFFLYMTALLIDIDVA